MALTFAANSAVLVNWGFSVGDIAVLAGAGRNVGTWVMTQVRDQTLLDFLRVDPEDLVPRKGIVDPTALHRRWDVSLALLENGRKRTISKSGTPLVESMPKFSWFMTLIVSALDASLQLSDFRKVLPQFLTRLFAENIDGLDYLLREYPQHVQGWMSAACVRNVLTRARSEWFALAERNVRMQGQIPSDDCREVERLLVWLAGACGQQQEKKFISASSDVYALAIVLQAIGFDLLSTSTTDVGSNESKLWVIYDPSIPVIGRPTESLGWLNEGRSGMRIPLNSMQECVSLWPGTVEENNFRRLLFERGMNAAEDIRETWCLKGSQGPFGLEDPAALHVGRVSNTLLYEVASSLFPLLNPAIIDEMSRIFAEYPGWMPRKGASTLHYLGENKDCLTQVQIFVLGYYYALLKPLIDTSQLAMQEGYGDWRWYDLSLLSQILNIMYKDSTGSRAIPTKTTLTRNHVLELLALLFVGANEDQRQAINDTVIGLHGKLTIVPASMLGDTDTSNSIMRFHLLDSDATAIPSNAMGMIYGGVNCSPLGVGVYVSEVEPCDLRSVDPNSLASDFSSHIEPDWDNDVQACHVVYRYKGRIIRRFSPQQIEHALYSIHDDRSKIHGYHLLDRVSDYSTLMNEQHPPVDFERMYMVDVERFFNRRYPCLNPDDSAKSLIVLATKGCSKARTCLQVICQAQGLVLARTKDSWEDVGWVDSSKGPTLLVRDKGEVSGLWGIMFA